MTIALGPGYAQPGSIPLVPQYRVKGDYWSFSVQFIDPIAGTPVPITPSLLPDGLFYPSTGVPPYEMTVANGGVTITDAPNSRAVFVVPAAVAALAPAMRPTSFALPQNFITRLQCRLIDSIGPQTYTITGVVPVDPATTDLSTIPAPTTIIAYAGPAGAPGPAPTQAQLMAAIQASVNQAVTVALQAQFGADFMTWFGSLPTALPSSSGQPWNDGGTFAVS